MSRSYYFTTSSLPALSLDQPPPFAWSDFIAALQTEVGEKDKQIISGADVDPPKEETEIKSDLLKHYRDWETSLRNDLVKIRASLTGRDPMPWLKEGESFYDTQTLAQQAARVDSPLEAEEILDRARWKKIDELSSGEYFNRKWLEAYALKLRILLRRALFDREKGERRYGELYEEILKRSDNDFTSGEFNG